MEDKKPLTGVSPACPTPQVWDPAQHLQTLRNCLDPNHPGYCYVEGMHDDIRTLIAAYENGKMPSHDTAYLKYAWIVLQAELVWEEVCFVCYFFCQSLWMFPVLYVQEEYCEVLLTVGRIFLYSMTEGFLRSRW